MAIDISFKGKVHKIGEEKAINENFRVANIVINDLDPSRPQFIEVELSNGRIENLAGIAVDDMVEVNAKLQGRIANTKSGEQVFNKISAYKLTKI